MSKDEIPESIVQIAHELGMNSAVRIPHKTREVYSIGMVDENGCPVPDGLPVLFEVINNIIVSVSDADVHKILSQLPDE